MVTFMALYTPVIIDNACQDMCTAFTVHQILDWELNSPDECKKKIYINTYYTLLFNFRLK